MSLPGRVQIAGVIDRAEAELIIEAGADMLGFPLGVTDGREDIDAEDAAAVVAATSDRATAVCITYLDTAEEITALCRKLGAQWVQLHGPIEVSEVAKLKAQKESFRVIKSLIVRAGTEAQILRQVEEFEPHVDGFITDTYDPDTGRSGATGKTHNWAVSREVVASTKRPVILAGGLNPENVTHAIATVGPAAVDAHTGVEEADGRKGADLVSTFVQRAHSAFRSGVPLAGPYSAESYSKRDFSGTDWLAFRDLPELLDRHLVSETRALPALDLGCGAGRSTRYLSSLGFEVVGGDINREMLTLAKRQQPGAEFVQLNDQSLPWRDGHFGLVLCTFVLMELGSLKQMRKLVAEARRVLHPRGRALFVVNTPDFYTGSWLSCDVEFEHDSRPLTSGQRVRVQLLPEDISIEDYFWTDEDYRSVFRAAGLSQLERHLPVGLEDDGRQWRDEYAKAPYAVYVLGR